MHLRTSHQNLGTSHLPTSHPGSRLHARVGLLFVLVVFGLPLFAGLGSSDLGNDEAIHSFAVERILESGEWLTPRAIPIGQPFFDKPPLKFWLVAGAMRLRALAPDDAGMRAVDASFGIAALVYVYFLGVRLAGPVCGVAAVLILCGFRPLLFDHGLRSNNMEATLVLAYCGGVFHFVRWADGGDGWRRAREALIVTLYFVLGFMTKFVAALFLPAILGASLVVRPGGMQLVRRCWRDWIVPLIVAVVLIAPWFVYQSVRPGGGRAFWYEILSVHVYRRMLGVLVPGHLAPWDYYFDTTWHELRTAGIRLVVAGGIVCLVFKAWRHRDWLSRILLIWFLLPYVVISFGTSKLLHYAYPFIPPLALGGGLAFALALGALRGDPGTRLAVRVRAGMPRLAEWAGRWPVQSALVAAGILLVGLAVWTAIRGDILLEVNDVRVLRNGSVVRPLLFAILCLGLTRWGMRVRLWAVAVLLFLLPIDRHVESVKLSLIVSHPLRTIRDCTVDVQRTSGLPPGVLRASGDVLHHSYYFYMRHTGAWHIANPPSGRVALARALEGPEPMPALVTAVQYQTLLRESRPGLAGVVIEDNVVFLLPGPFEVCVPRALAAGARPLLATTGQGLRDVPPGTMPATGL